MTLEERYHRIDAEVAQLCEACGRPRDAVRVIGVSKTVDVDAITQALAAGLHDFGENRPDELVRKHDAFPDENWHFIGNIQSRQLKHVVGRASLIHSLYQRDHASKIDRLAAQAGIVQDVLIEVNNGEENKQGLADTELLDMLMACHELSHLRVVGLMIMAPQGSRERAQAAFDMLATLRDTTQAQLARQGVHDINLRELSMGMSEDYREAIPRGATMVRIGRAIFSDNHSPAFNLAQR